MTQSKSSVALAPLFLGISVFGLCLLPFLVISTPHIFPIILWQSQIIGGLFIIICILGLIAGVSPRHCSLQFRSRNEREVMTPEKRTPIESQELEIGRQGHHPTCEHFASHIIQLGSRIYCAGCTGLVTGAIMSLVIAMAYFFLGLSLFSGVIIFWSGFFMVAFGLLQHLLYRIFRVCHGWIRVFMNIIFVVGSGLLLVGVTELTNNLILQCYLLLLILYWIFTRIVMSKRTHYQICVQCDLDGCSLSEA